MDKSTLSNYGWVVIAVLVLSVMIALATPFGTYISNAVKSTTEGLFQVEQKALGAAGLVVDDQKFDDANSGFDAEVITPVKLGKKYIYTTDNDGDAMNHIGHYVIFYADGSMYDSTYDSTMPAGIVTYTEIGMFYTPDPTAFTISVSDDGTTMTQIYNGEITYVLTLESAI